MRAHDIDAPDPQAAAARSGAPERPRAPGELQRRLVARPASPRVPPGQAAPLQAQAPQARPGSVPTDRFPPDRFPTGRVPTGRVIGRFRSRTLDWIDPDSGEHLRGRFEAPDTYLEELSRLAPGSFRTPGTPAGDRASHAAPPDGRTRPTPETPALGRGSFWVRVSSGIRLPGDRNDL